MVEKTRNRWMFAGFVLLALIAMCGCSVEPPRGRKPSPDWSRGHYLGQFVSGSTTVALDQTGGDVLAVWPIRIRGESAIQFVRFTNDAKLLQDRELDLPAGNLRSPKLLKAADGRFHLVWASRVAGRANWVLSHCLLDNDGTVISPITQLNAENSQIGGYDACSDSAGRLFAVWDNGDAGGISGAWIGSDGNLEAAPFTVADGGQRPSVRADNAGVWHLAWLDATAILYQAVPATEGHTVPIPVAYRGGGTGVSLVGPEIGLSDGWVYVLWYLQNQSGLEAGTARTEFVAFPKGSPNAANPLTVGLSRAEVLEYQAYTGDLALTQIVLPALPQFQSDFTYGPEAAYGERTELAVALTVYQEYQQEVYAQTAVALFKNGSMIGYQPASKTEGLSQEAALATDTAGNLYMTWREGAGGNRVYYATSNPTARASLDRLDSQDVLQATLRGSMEGLSSLAMLPFALVWLAPGFILLILVEMVWPQERQSHEINRVILSIAVIVYIAFKVLLFPTIITYVPLTAWLDLPAAVGAALQVVVPVLTLGLGLLVALLLRRNRSESNLLFYVATTGVDAVLTLMLYGVNFWTLV